MTDYDLESQFDQWASSYDADVRNEEQFPFAGYRRVLSRVVDAARITPGMEVLELGVGTGNLTQRLVAAGAAVWALDFSAEMLARAREKVPQATYAQAHLMSSYPAKFERCYDRIVSTYTFHELPLAEKRDLLKRLFDGYLKPGGFIVIGDIGFTDVYARNNIRQKAGEAWDEEYYWIETETAAPLLALGLAYKWERVTFCAFVLSIYRSA